MTLDIKHDRSLAGSRGFFCDYVECAPPDSALADPRCIRCVIAFKAAMKNGVRPWRGNVGNVFPFIPEASLASLEWLTVDEWLERAKALHSGALAYDLLGAAT